MYKMCRSGDEDIGRVIDVMRIDRIDNKDRERIVGK